MSTISTSGIAPSSVIRAEHILRIINALNNNANNDILISGSLTVTGSTSLSGSLNVTGGITGSFSGNGSQLTGVTAEWDGSHNGNASITGSLNVSGGITGSLNGTSSYALTASYALAGGVIINTGSFATTGSNQFNGSQGITGSITIADNDLLLFMNQNFIIFENLNSPNDIGVITRLGSTYTEGGNTQAFLFPTNPTGGYKTITLPNDTGTVALTYNTATTGSNTFSGNQIITGSVNITSVLTLTPNDPLPSGQPTGSIAVSGSGVDCKPYFWNGSTWTSMI